MSLEAGSFIADLVATNPVGATDFVSQGDDHIRLLKACIQGSFPNLGAAAVTSSAAELNILDGATLSTAELNFVDGVTSSIQTQLNAITTALPLSYQPLDSDLTAIAGLATSTYGRDFLALANDAALATKIAALVPTWSGAHIFNGAATFNAATKVNAIAGANAIGLTLDVASATSENLVAWKLNAVAKAYTGLIGTATHLVNSSAQNDYAIRLESANLLISTDGGTTANMKVGSAGNVTLAAPTSGTTLILNAGASLLAAVADAPSSYTGYGINENGTLKWRILNNWDASGTLSFVNPTLGGSAFNCTQAGLLSTWDGATLREVGYRGLHRRDFSTSDNYAATDNGKYCRYTGSGGHTFTIDSDLAGDAMVTIINATSVALTIAESLSGGMFWLNGGAGGSGSRTLAANGVATVLGISGTDAYIFGTGLS